MVLNNIIFNFHVEDFFSNNKNNLIPLGLIKFYFQTHCNHIAYQQINFHFLSTFFYFRLLNNICSHLRNCEKIVFIKT